MMDHAETFTRLYALYGSDLPITDAVSDLQMLVRRVEARPELTEAERARIEIAGNILVQIAIDVRKRLLYAQPNTTTFTVCGI